MICKKCNCTVSDSSNFCEQCGCNLSEQNNIPEKIVCPRCNAITDNSNFCTVCRCALSNLAVQVVQNEEKTNQRNLQLQMQAAQLNMQQEQLRLQQEQMGAMARCPRCGSTSLSGNKKGFGIGKAVVGAWALGPIGLVAGNMGAKKVRITCMKCGKKYFA